MTSDVGHCLNFAASITWTELGSDMVSTNSVGISTNKYSIVFSCVQLSIELSIELSVQLNPI